MLFRNPLDRILGQASKVSVLRFLVGTRAQMSGRAIARAVGISHIQCHVALRELCAHGLVTVRHVGRSALYEPATGHVLFKNLLKPLFDEESRLLGRLRDVILKGFAKHRPVSIVMFGSTLAGTARPDSDIDALIVVRDGDSLKDARKAVEAAERAALEMFGNRLAPVLITEAALRKRVRGKAGIYAEVAKTGRTIYGKSFEEMSADVRV